MDDMQLFNIGLTSSITGLLCSYILVTYLQWSVSYFHKISNTRCFTVRYLRTLNDALPLTSCVPILFVLIVVKCKAQRMISNGTTFIKSSVEFYEWVQNLNCRTHSIKTLLTCSHRRVRNSDKSLLNSLETTREQLEGFSLNIGRNLALNLH
jgi:hypothetical protein